MGRGVHEGGKGLSLPKAKGNCRDIVHTYNSQVGPLRRGMGVLRVEATVRFTCQGHPLVTYVCVLFSTFTCLGKPAMLATWMPKDSRQGPSRTSYSIVILSSYNSEAGGERWQQDRGQGGLPTRGSDCIDMGAITPCRAAGSKGESERLTRQARHPRGGDPDPPLLSSAKRARRSRPFEY